MPRTAKDLAKDLQDQWKLVNDAYYAAKGKEEALLVKEAGEKDKYYAACRAEDGQAKRTSDNRLNKIRQNLRHAQLIREEKRVRAVEMYHQILQYENRYPGEIKNRIANFAYPPDPILPRSMYTARQHY